MVLLIFISYSHEDFKKEAFFLQKYLSHHTPLAEIFVDQNRAKGGKWDDEIKAKLRKSHIVVILLTNGALKSIKVEEEVEIAKEITSRKIVPCKDDLLDISWPRLPWNLYTFDGLEFETIEELGRKLVKEIKKIRKSNSNLQKIDYDSYLDKTYGESKIAWLTNPTSSTLKEIDEIAYNEGFSNWSIDSEYESVGGNDDE